jgi:hypothetical protein
LDLDAELRLHLVARKHQPDHSESAVHRRGAALCELRKTEAINLSSEARAACSFPAGTASAEGFHSGRSLTKSWRSATIANGESLIGTPPSVTCTHARKHTHT